MDLHKERYSFEDFKEIIKILRSENGCPWDKEQTHSSLRKNLIEESYEFIHEVDTDSKAGMCEELGDVLLQVVMHAQIASETGDFTMEDVIDGIAKKMLFRHPHVFGEKKANNAEEALESFKAQKSKEKKYKNVGDSLEKIPGDLPALIKVYKLASQLRKMQPEVFKSDVNEWFDKLYATLHELEDMQVFASESELEDKIGEVFGILVMIGNIMGVDSEVSANKEFESTKKRIERIEEKMLKEGEKIAELSPETFEEYWEKTKNVEK
ncbi:MAG: MazG family protein [Clostridia bacterium]|nr:MazG family protein [Clostridia bacterium]